jgi:chlorite dismutase
VTSHARYVERPEKVQLDASSPVLDRAEASYAALIPIKKSAEWWALPQDERRDIFEARSHHIADSMKYLPRIARRLYHSRDLGEPFDFLTWFEFAPEHSQAFDDLLGCCVPARSGPS